MELTRASIEQLLAKFDRRLTVTHPPDITSLLHSNDLPSLLQVSNVKASAKILENVGREIQAAIDLLGNAVASLEAQMSRIRSLQRDYSLVLSPIRRVPAEIVMEILRRTWTAVEDRANNPHINGFNVFTIAEGPWHLGHVCRLWRDVVSTLCPELWATITIAIPGHQLDISWHPKDVVEMLERALERTRGHPLDFLFAYCHSRSIREADIMRQCFDIMTAHSAQWRMVEFIIRPSFLPHLSVVRGKVDWLTDIYIQCWPDPGSHSAPIAAFEIAPRLRNFYLKGMHPEAQFTFPATNLISFYDERPFAGDLLTPEYIDIIRSSTNLISFSYHDYADPPELLVSQLAYPRVIDQSVQTLSVSSASFMRSVELPMLCEVVLTAGYDKDRMQQVFHLPTDAIMALSELLHHSQCSLIRLSVVDTTILDVDLAAVL